MITETTTTTETPIGSESHSGAEHALQKRMIRLKPTQGLGERFPAMHLVRSSWFARFLSMLVFILLIGFTITAIFLPWQQTSRCDGEVVALSPQKRRQVVQSQAKGIVKFVGNDLREGSYVQEGDVIMVLEPQVENQLELSKRAEDEVKKNIAFAEVLLGNSKRQKETETESYTRALEALDASVKASEAKWNQTQREIDGQKAKWKQSVEVLERAIKLRGELYSELDYRKAENAEEEEEQKLLKLHAAEDEAYNDLLEKQKSQQSKKKEIEGKIIELDSKINKADGDLSKLNKELTEVSAKLGELARLEITSPSTGWIQAILAQEGTNSVKEGDKLFEVIPDTSDLAVDLHVRGNDLPMISVGDHVRLQFEGWPAVQFMGWPNVAVGTFPGIVIAINPADDAKGSFKIMVGPDPNDPKQVKWPDRRYNDYYLRQGVRVNAWVILRTVPLGLEIWRQLNGFPASKSDPGDGKGEKDPKMPKFK